MTIIQGPYFSDLLAQPESLGRLIVSLQSASLGADFQPVPLTKRFNHVVMTGMGSSLHALYPLHRKLSRLGLCSHWIESAELLIGFDSLYSPDTLLIVVSQSGESAEIVTLAQRANSFGHFIGVTNGEDSRLAQSAASTILLRAGSESTVSCKTYLNSLAALHWLGVAMTGENTQQALHRIDTARRAISDYLVNFERHINDLIPTMDNIDSIFVTGRGDSLATAGTGGLILKESTRQHAEGMSCAAFRHGPMEMASENVLVVIIEGSGPEALLNRRLANDINRGGGNAVIIGVDGEGPFQLPNVPADVRPMMEILPIQMLSLALAARDGIEAGRFERASKITSIA